MELLSSVSYDADLTAETLEFASGKPGTSMPGSLYFESGRIRLVHENGPKIVKHEGIRRYSLSERGVRNLNRYRHRKWDDKRIYEGLREHRNLHRIKLDNGETLIEFFVTARGKTRKHVSRGGAITAPALNQVQINLMARAAVSRSNTEMRTVYPYALSHLRHSQAEGSSEHRAVMHQRPT